MAKSFPLPPEVPEKKTTAAGPVFEPGFAGVVVKVPKPPPRPPLTDGGASITSLEPEAASSSEGLSTPLDYHVAERVSTVAEPEEEIPVDLIDVSPYQPRIRIDEESLMRLAQSMDAGGQIYPIIVRRMPNGRYELIGGERRYRATLLTHRPTIRASIKHVGDAEAALMALADNDAREDLTDFERGRKYQQLIQTGVATSQSDLARRIGRERVFIQRCISFFKLPAPVVEMLEARPDLMGGSYAMQFVAVLESRKGQDSDLVIEAINKVFEGKLDITNALNWLKGAVRVRQEPASKPASQALHLGGKRVGEIKVEGRKVVIVCSDGVSAADVVESLMKGAGTAAT